MDNNPTPQPPKPQGVMDVQPPKPPAVTDAPQPPAAPPTPEPTPEVPPSNIGVSPAVVEATEHPPEAEAAKPAGLSPELLAQAQKETNKPAEPHAADPKHQLAAHNKKKKGPRLVIFLAVVVALALSGVAVYAYMSSQDKKEDHPAEHTQPEQQATDQPTTQPATTTDVDEATKAADDAMNSTDEAQDLPDGGLNEGSVGL